MQHISEDGGVLMLPRDASLPDFTEAIRFEPRELTKYFEVGCFGMWDCGVRVCAEGWAVGDARSP